MRWIPEVMERLRAQFFRRQVDAETDEEMRFHLDMEAERRARESGLEPAEARRQAAIAFGGVERHKEAVRDARGWGRLSGLSLDVKLGARMLVKYPGLTLASVFALAVAVALAASWFEFLGDMTRPHIPLADGDRIVVLDNWDRERAAKEPRSLYEFELWRSEASTVRELSAFTAEEYGITTDDERYGTVELARIHASGLAVARVRPLLGRTLIPADEEASGTVPVVLGYRVWQTMFDGDRGVVGRSLRVGDAPGVVVGVMPEGFSFPVNQEVWVPFRAHADPTELRAGPPISMVGRLAPDASLKSAQAELATIGRRLAAERPETHRHLEPRVRRFAGAVSMPPLVQLMNIPFLLFLVVVSANVATLVFARTVARSSEIAVRSALGASRRRLVLQLVAEALVLTAAGTALGLAAASWGMRKVMALFWEVQQSRAPFWFDDSLAPLTILYACVLALFAALLIGGIPALKATGRKLRMQFSQAGSGGAGMRFGAISTAVIVVQVALCVAFLPYAFEQVRALRPGEQTATTFPADAFLSGRLVLEYAGAEGQGSEAEERARAGTAAALSEQVKLRLLDRPGIAAVTYASWLPGFNQPPATLQLKSDSSEMIGTRLLGVDPDFFRMMRGRIIAGRDFAPAEYDTDTGSLIVEAAWAEEVFGGRNPLGQRIRFPEERDEAAARRWYEVVGVVDGLEEALGPGEPIGVFRPLLPELRANQQLFVHTTVPAETMAREVYAAATAVDPRLRLDRLEPLDDTWAPVLRSNIYFLAVLNVVGFIIVLFALIGIYALMAFTVGQRTREIAIRSALGARPSGILRSIFGRALAQIGVGVLLGATLVSATMFRTAEGLRLVAVMSALMMVIGLAGCAVPALRALRIQPTAALRSE